MNKDIATTDNYYLSIAKLKVMKYILVNEVDSFMENEFNHDHIFVVTVVSCELNLAYLGSELYKIYELTNHLVNNPNDHDKANELSDVVKEISRMGEEELMEMFC